ncbi:unnamed protein product [Linum trigynum]|uniref:Uncharacterized protein n=1 Tax=Linum trigynum TaxID=586398 RepID=A0AAV2D809_9ROSI
MVSRSESSSSLFSSINVFSWHVGDFSIKLRSWPPDLEIEGHDFTKWLKANPSAATCRNSKQMQTPELGNRVTFTERSGNKVSPRETIMLVRKGEPARLGMVVRRRSVN